MVPDVHARGFEDRRAALAQTLARIDSHSQGETDGHGIYARECCDFLFFNPITFVQGCPVTFSAILNYLRGLNYFQRPDYVGLERLFILMMQARNVSQSQPMSWETNVSLLRKASFLLNFSSQFQVIRHDHKGRARNTKAQMEQGAKSCHTSASGTLKYTL